MIIVVVGRNFGCDYVVVGRKIGFDCVVDDHDFANVVVGRTIGFWIFVAGLVIDFETFVGCNDRDFCFGCVGYS